MRTVSRPYNCRTDLALFEDWIFSKWLTLETITHGCRVVAIKKFKKKGVQYRIIGIFDTADNFQEGALEKALKDECVTLETDTNINAFIAKLNSKWAFL